jgi:hypothetical protein
LAPLNILAVMVGVKTIPQQVEVQRPAILGMVLGVVTAAVAEVMVVLAAAE